LLADLSQQVTILLDLAHLDVQLLGNDFDLFKLITALLNARIVGCELLETAFEQITGLAGFDCTLG